MSSPSTDAAGRTQRLGNVALLSSGGHTFVIERKMPEVDGERTEEYVLTTPCEEGEVTVMRCGPRNEGPFGVEIYSLALQALPTERALWWAHALHATASFADQLNGRMSRQVTS